jgi:hypothetical protein
MVHRLVLGLHTVRLDPRRHRLDALALARQQQAGAVGPRRGGSPYPVLFTNAGENWRQFPDFPLLATDELDSLPRHMRHPLGETPPTQLIDWLF